MIKISQIEIKKLKSFFQKLLKILGENAFLTSLALLFIALILGGLTFYKYSILAERGKPEALERIPYFNEKTFQEILRIWQNRQKRFEEAGLKEYPDPFR